MADKPTTPPSAEAICAECGKKFDSLREGKTRRAEMFCSIACADKAHPDMARGVVVTEEMVSRFLSWKLPEDFHPDGGISFNPEFNVEYNAKLGLPPARHQPIGTNLLTATQAKAMLEHVLAVAPSETEWRFPYEVREVGIDRKPTGHTVIVGFASPLAAEQFYKLVHKRYMEFAEPEKLK